MAYFPCSVSDNSKMDKDNPTATGTLTMTGDGVFSGDVTINSTLSVSNAVSYSTTETYVGKWTDGRLIYRKVFTGLSISTTANTWIDTGASKTGIFAFLDGKVLDSSGQVFPCAVGFGTNISINMPLARSNINALIVDYLKP